MKTYLLLLISAVALLSCGPSYKLLKTKTEPGFRLTDYPTFGFYTIDAQGDTMPERFEQNIMLIKDAIKKNLEARGLTEAQEPALKVNIGITVQEKIQTRQTNFQNDGRPMYMGQRRYSWKSQEVEVGRYKEGTLLVDLINAADNHMVWSGGSEGIIPKNNQQFESSVNEMVDKILAGLK